MCEALRLLGVCIMLGGTIVWLLTLVNVSMTPSWTTRMAFNTYGEGRLELAMFCFGTIMGLYVLYDAITRCVNTIAPRPTFAPKVSVGRGPLRLRAISAAKQPKDHISQRDSP